MTSSDCRSRSESEEKSLRANSGLLFNDALEAGLLDARHPRLGHGLGEHVLPAPLDQAELAEDPAVLEEGGGGLFVVAVDLVEPDRTGE
jgi:hypothetical protein